VAPLKAATTQYFMSSGTWPENLEALGFDAAAMTNSMIDGVTVGPEGTLRLRLNRRLGEHKAIALTPSVVMGGTQVEWNCFSNFPNELFAGPGPAICQSRAIP
jgi:hypothetical protein